MTINSPLDKRVIDWHHSLRNKKTWWAIGLFEGEGTIIAGRRMSLAMTDEDTVRRFCDVVGSGVISGPYRDKVPNRKPMWRWDLNDTRTVYHLLKKWYPHLSEHRRAQADRYFAAVPQEPRRRRAKRAQVALEEP